MTVRLHPHAEARMAERGAAPEEVEATVAGGERFPARFGRTGFRRNFTFDQTWRGRRYPTKQIEACGGGGWRLAGDHGHREVFLMPEGAAP